MASDVMVAVSKHPSSLSALKWAINNRFVEPGDTVKLVHVRPPVRAIPSPMGNSVPVNQLSSETVAAYMRDLQLKTEQELRAHQNLCNTWKIQAEFTIVESDKIALSLLDQITRLNAKKFIIGTSTSNAILRKFKGDSVAWYILKNASDKCSVYVISKGKLVNVKEARQTYFKSDASNIKDKFGHNIPNNAYTEGENKGSFSISDDGSELLEREHPEHVRRLHRDVKGFASPLLLQRERATSLVNFNFTQSDVQTDLFSRKTFSNKDIVVSESSFESQVRMDSPVESSSSENTSVDCMEDHAYTKVDEGTELMNNIKKAVSLSHVNSISSSRPMNSLIHMQSAVAAAQINSSSQHVSKSDRNVKAHLSHSQSQDDETDQHEEVIDLEKLKLELEAAQQRVVKAEQSAAVATQKAAELDIFAKNEAKKREHALILAQHARSEAAEEARRSQEAKTALEAAKLAAQEEVARRKAAEDRANKEALDRQKALAALQQAKTKYRQYEYQELQAATDNFSECNRIGLGGYGPVYKGKLLHTTVAIKVLKQDSVQGPKEFQQEIEVLSRMHHPHMILLLGACPQKGCLVYEYLANGSLEDRLLRRDNSAPLPWHTRFCIAAEVATALLFLHSSKPDPYVHRDLKPANILLDQNMRAKLGDVGLARLAPGIASESITEYRETTPVGTYAYIDPEYQRTGVFTPRSDVYAFGLVILQLLTGKGPIGLTNIVEHAVEENKLGDVLDPTAGKWPDSEALELAYLGIQCSELRRKKRPDLATILPKLEQIRTSADDYLVQVVWSKQNISEGQRAVPSFFLCPISKEMMEDPHIAADGFTYEYTSIRQWLQHHKTSPVTSSKLKHRQLTPNHSLRTAIREWKQRMASC